MNRIINRYPPGFYQNAGLFYDYAKPRGTATIDRRPVRKRTTPPNGRSVYLQLHPQNAVRAFLELDDAGLPGSDSRRHGQCGGPSVSQVFNLDELDPATIPVEPIQAGLFEVYEKLDGSLGILYWLGGKPQIATRGSFTSEQAVRATRLLHERYVRTFDHLDRSKTYLFEIIYPENRIVVNYGEREDLVLLAIIDTATGSDEDLLNYETIGFPVVKRYDGITDYRTLVSHTDDNAEGFVIKFKSGLRTKIKLAEYVRLHRILTGVSNLAIWEYMAAGRALDEILDAVPDEFYAWVKQTKDQLTERYAQIEDECRACFKDLGDRKTNALYYQTQRYPSVLFKMLGNQPYEHIIWKHIRPTYQKAFKTDEA